MYEVFWIAKYLPNGKRLAFFIDMHISDDSIINKKAAISTRKIGFTRFFRSVCNGN